MKLKPTETFTRWRQRLARRKIYTFVAHGIDDDGKCDCGQSDCRAPGKHPRFSGADRGATIDPVRIESEARFKYANVGLHCGLSRIVAFDVDPRNGGLETMAALQAQFGPFDPAVAVDTGGGGEHLYYRAPDGVTFPATLGPGVDVLSGSKYPIIPPSRHHSGGVYRWRGGHDLVSDDFLLTHPPGWVLNFNPRPTSNAKAVSVEETEEEVARLRSALDYVSADCHRDEWRDNVFALHWTGWACAEELAREWSMTAPDRWTESAFASIWEKANAERPGGRTIASIFYAAKRNGWVDPTGPSRAETLGDIDNGRRFAERYRGELILDRASALWRQYVDGIWRPCNTGQHIAAAKEIAETILHEAAKDFAAQPTDANKASYSQALKVHRTAPRIHAAIEMAAAEPGMSVADPSAFDSDPYLLGVMGGAIDLRTGQWIPPSPLHMISKCVGVRYDPEATCPRFQAFLADILPNKLEVRFLQRFIGYTLTGSVEEEVFLFMQGSGANGKSVLANVLSKVMGEYAVTVGSELMAVTKNDSEALRFKARLRGARLALVNEVGQNDTFNDQRVKEIVSREAIPSRQLYGEAFDFMPTHTLWVRGNHRPAVLDAGDGMWRRLLLLPFLRQFGPDERVRNLDQQLFDEEGSGILNWSLKGCLQWQKQGLNPPPSITRETAMYRDETDVVGEWIESVCEVGPGFRCSVPALYASYRSYFLEAGMSPKSQIAFSRMMGPKGYRSTKSNGVRYFKGIGLSLNDI